MLTWTCSMRTLGEAREMFSAWSCFEMFFNTSERILVRLRTMWRVRTRLARR